MVANNTFHWVTQPNGTQICIPNYTQVKDYEGFCLMFRSYLGWIIA